MADREIVTRGLWCCTHPGNCDECPYGLTLDENNSCVRRLLRAAHELIVDQTGQEATRQRLQVHNIGNVDIPDGVSEEDFHKVMNNVVEALEHTERGESWPYDTGGETNANG